MQALQILMLVLLALQILETALGIVLLILKASKKAKHRP